MDQRKKNKEGILITIEKYISYGKLNRVVIKTDRNNYLVDLPLNSFIARSFLVAAISLLKVFSLVIQNFKVAIVKFTTGNIV